MMVQEANNAQEWDAFLALQTFRPFLQSWTMGEVYRDTAQEPIRLEVRDEGKIAAICLAILVPARRGRHLMIPYGPVINMQLSMINYQLILDSLIQELTNVARAHGCAFIRMSPFWPLSTFHFPLSTAVASPLHLLAEHLWYLPLQAPDPWTSDNAGISPPSPALPPVGKGGTRMFPPPPGEGPRVGEMQKTEDALLMAMRKTTRNLIHRAERDGVTVEASADPNRDIEHFIALHEETRRRHGFTPYTNAFFRAQVRRFAERNECTLYLARFQGEVAAASIHMHAFGETSYHHGASTHRLSKIPASYLLQWTAIRDALKRGDYVYNFWGIAPLGKQEGDQLSAVSCQLKSHPFAGVTLFKTGFGGQLLELQHCMDFPLSARYHFTRAFELLRKWKRGF